MHTNIRKQYLLSQQWAKHSYGSEGSGGEGDSSNLFN